MSDDPTIRLHVTVHEAGHALAAFQERIPVTHAVLGEHGGLTQWVFQPLQKVRVHVTETDLTAVFAHRAAIPEAKILRVLLGGLAAEMLVFSGILHPATHPDDDVRQAVALAKRVLPQLRTPRQTLRPVHRIYMRLLTGLDVDEEPCQLEYLARQWDQAVQGLMPKYEWLQAVANALGERGELSGQEIRRLRTPC